MKMIWTTKELVQHFTIQAGETIVRFTVREDDARLDAVRLEKVDYRLLNRHAAKQVSRMTDLFFAIYSLLFPVTRMGYPPSFYGKAILENDCRI
jgi:hypothetical protein